MGGVAKAVNKILGGGGSNASTRVVDTVTTKSQATMQEKFDDVSGSDKKKRTKTGKKSLQIPTQTSGVSTAGTGGTGLGTGV